MKLGFHAKLVLLVSVFGFALVAVSLILVSARLASHFRIAAHDDVAAASSAIDASMRASVESYRSRASLVADDTLAKEALLSGRPELLFTFADSAHDRTKTVFLVVLDARGRVLVDPDRRFGEGSAPLGPTWKPGPYDGFAQLRVAREAGSTELAAIAIVPVELGGKHLGYLLLGDPVTPAWLASAQAGARASVTLVDPTGRLFATTLRPDQTSSIAIAACEGTHELELAGDSHVARFQPIAGPSTPIGCAIVARSLAPQHHALSALRRWMLLLGLAITGIAIVGSIVVGFRIARPLRSLTHAAHGIASGNISQQQALEVSGGDEIAQLAHSFNDMLGTLRELARVADHLSRGDLAVQPKLSGEVGAVFERMLASERDIVRQLNQTSFQLAGAAAQIYAATQEQEGTITHQTVGAEEVSRTMQSLLDSASHIAESARGVLSSAEQSRETAEQMVARLGDLRGHAGRIVEILDVIREIAERSDLLALNASLESSRAGEAGRPFALVAAEMRRLAERVTGSVADVRAMIADIRMSSQAASASTDDGRRLVDGTTEAARRITLITQQQQTATEQVLQSMRHIGAVIAESASASQQTRASASVLKGEAERLATLVGRFSTGEAAATPEPINGSTRP